MKLYVVRDAVIDPPPATWHSDRPYDGRWTGPVPWPLAWLLLWKITHGRYRGTRPWTHWRVWSGYAVPKRGDLVVVRA